MVEMTDEPGLPNGLSDSECEELLAGRRADLPVGAMLQALGGPLGGELPGEAAAMAAFRAAAAGATPMPRRGRASGRVVAAGVGSAVVLLGGVAAAASGTVRQDIGNLIGVHVDHNDKPDRARVPVTPEPTSAPDGGSVTPSPTATAVSPTGHGKAHAGHGKGRGVGETAQPSHPVHPTHPSHPTQAANSTHPAKPHPTQAANRSHHATPSHRAKPTQAAQPTKKPHPTQAANSSRSANSRSADRGGR
jgi:hypothetical protein